MALLDQLNQTTNFLTQEADRYIDDLINDAAGDKDFIISQIKRQHEVALGKNDQQTAQFLESVADKLEERIGRIPYDYQVGVTRANEDLQRVTDVTTRNRDKVLSRLTEDEQVWKQQFNKSANDARTNQQEALLERGILSGTRQDAQGLAGEEVRNLEQDLGETLSAYDRALGRERVDVNEQASDTLFDANRQTERTLQDLRTGARRAGIDQQDDTRFGTESATRKFDATKKELERQRQRLKEMAGTRALVEARYRSQ